MKTFVAFIILTMSMAAQVQSVIPLMFANYYWCDKNRVSLEVIK